MFRTDAEGNDSGLYTEGNPSTGIPSTVISASAANSWQEEICNVVEAAGITLNKLNNAQLLQAINAIVQQGGQTPVETTVANNQTTAVDVSGMSFSGTAVRAVTLDVYAYRYTDSEENAAKMTVYMLYKPDAAAWSVSWDSQGDSMRLTFHMSGNQLQYKSDNMAGTNYSGRLLVTVNRINNVTP